MPHIENFFKKIGNGSSSILYEGRWLVELQPMTSDSSGDLVRKAFNIPSSQTQASGKVRSFISRQSVQDESSLQKLFGQKKEIHINVNPEKYEETAETQLEGRVSPKDNNQESKEQEAEIGQEEAKIGK